MIGYGKTKNVFAVFFGAMALLSIAVVNGQPFFFPDTTNYVREADAAVVWAFGSRFATSWTDPFLARKLDPSVVESKDPLAEINRTETNLSPNRSPLRAEHTNSLQSGVILSGRSAYYGFLLYLGEIGRGFWFTIAAQALTVSYVLHLISVRCFFLPLRTFIICISILASLSTAPFFVGFLMPYIFAAVAILITGIFIAFWGNITRFERIALAFLLVFSLLSHLSHLLICISMLSIYVVLIGSSWFRIRYFRLACAAAIAACISAGAAGEIAFNFVVTKITGTTPITPPLIMARLINLGPGLEYLKTHCGQSHFIICEYQKRLPLDTDSFIWSYDPTVGVFAPGSPEIKRALSDEQFSFVLKVFEFDPGGVLYSALRAGMSQLTTFDLDEFRNKDSQWDYYSARLPRKYWNTMQGTLAFRDGWLIDTISKIDFFIVMLSCMFLILVKARYSKASEPSAVGVSNIAGSSNLFVVIIGVGIISNAFVCGALSTVHDHYQARVVWLVPFVAMLVFSELFVVPKAGDRLLTTTMANQSTTKL